MTFIRSSVSISASGFTDAISYKTTMIFGHPKVVSHKFISTLKTQIEDLGFTCLCVLSRNLMDTNIPYQYKNDMGYRRCPSPTALDASNRFLYSPETKISPIDAMHYTKLSASNDYDYNTYWVVKIVAQFTPSKPLNSKALKTKSSRTQHLFADPLGESEAEEITFITDFICYLSDLARKNDYDFLSLPWNTSPQDFGLLVSDADSTFFQGEAIDELAKIAGVAEEITLITAEAMNGKISFTQSLEKRVAILSGLPICALDEVRNNISVTAGGLLLLEQLKKNHTKMGIVSGGFTEILSPVIESLGIDYLSANAFEICDHKISGKLSGPVVSRATKAEKLSMWAKNNSIPLSNTIAMGDGSNDLDMLEICGLPVAVGNRPAISHIKNFCSHGSLIPLADLLSPVAV